MYILLLVPISATHLIDAEIAFCCAFPKSVVTRTMQTSDQPTSPLRLCEHIVADDTVNCTVARYFPRVHREKITNTGITHGNASISVTVRFFNDVGSASSGVWSASSKSSANSASKCF
jgi:hypothetical protein